MSDRLWTPTDLAAFLCLSPRTVQARASRDPGSLPPRVAALSRQRWSPEVCRAWVEAQSGVTKNKGGRPRKAM